MATAKIIPTPPLPPPPPEVHLKLTMREAEVLFRITCMVGGIDEIRVALSRAGVKDAYVCAGASGDINFP